MTYCSIYAVMYEPLVPLLISAFFGAMTNLLVVLVGTYYFKTAQT